MRVADVRRPADRRIVVLDGLEGDRQLPIWIGEPEAASLVAALEDVELPRPSAHHFAGALLRAAGGELREGGVSRLARERPDYLGEVSGPHDGASVQADEVRARLAKGARELAEFDTTT